MVLFQVEQAVAVAAQEEPKVPLMMVAVQVVVKQVDLDQVDQAQLILVAAVEEDLLLEPMAPVVVVKLL